jgi:hypothetical protein
MNPSKSADNLLWYIILPQHKLGVEFFHQSSTRHHDLLQHHGLFVWLVVGADLI